MYLIKHEPTKRDAKFENQVLKLVNKYYGKRNTIKGIILDLYFDEGSEIIRSLHTYGSKAAIAAIRERIEGAINK